MPVIPFDLIAHADWSLHPGKRWLAWAEKLPSGGYHAHPPQVVDEAHRLLDDLRARAGAKAAVLVGFDFPIGLPETYARLAGVTDFLAVLPRLGEGEWRDFYRPAETAAQIHLRRPFYPAHPGGTHQQQLLDGLGVQHIDQLRRRCELASRGRRAAAPLFWTLGGQQVGKAALSGWRDVLAPGLQVGSVRIWPFAGRLETLCQPGNTVIAETYPAEVYTQLKFKPRIVAGKPAGKRAQAWRAAQAEIILRWVAQANLELAPGLQGTIETGFGPAKAAEDPFDALVGLCGMLAVALGEQPPGDPDTSPGDRVEGWILGKPQGAI